MQNQDQLNGQSPKAEERPASAPAVNSSASSEVKVDEKDIVKNIVAYMEKHKEELAEHYLSVKTKADDNNNRPQSEMYNCVAIENDAYFAKLLSVSVVILTANYFESEILNLNLSKKYNCPVLRLKDDLQLLQGEKLSQAYILELESYTILHLHAPDTGSNTPCGSADLVRYVNECEYLNPNCIISFGICFGTNMKDYNLGDSIIAKKIYPWSIGVKISRDKQGNTTWTTKSDDYIISLETNARGLFRKIEEVCNATTNLCIGQKVHLGNMITSEAVVSNELVKRSAEVAAHGWEIIGGEMEGYGLVKEALYYGPHENGMSRIACVILKAICDWGAVKNFDEDIEQKLNSVMVVKKSYKDQLQAYTAYCAYKVLEDLFEKKVFDNNNILSSFTKYIKNLFTRNNGIMSVDRFHQYIFEWLANSYVDYQASDLRLPVEKYNRLSMERLNNYIKMLSSLVLENTNEYYLDNSTPKMIYRHPIQK